MNNYQKLIELLNKEELSTKEKEYIKNLCSKDPEAEKIAFIHKNLKTSLNKKKKITTEQLADYILYLNGLEPKDKNIITLIPEIEKQLRLSEELNNEFKLLNSEYLETDQFVSQILEEKTTKEEKQDSYKTIAKHKLFKWVPIYTVSTVAIVYIILLITFNIFTPDYKKNIFLYGDFDNTNSRGRISETFQQSLIYINNNDYKTAIKLLNEDIAKNSDSKTIFYSHYILGMLYLRESQSNFLGIIKSYNEEKIQEGIRQLELAIEKNTNDQFKNINLDAYFFIANGYLALNNIEKAKTYFEKVKNEKGRYIKNAEYILELLNDKK